MSAIKSVVSDTRLIDVGDGQSRPCGDNAMKTSVSRRVAITGCCVAAMEPLKVAALNADPILPLIEKHKDARKAFDAALTAEANVNDVTPRRRRPSVELGVSREVALTVDGVTTVIPSRPFCASEREQITEHFAAELLKPNGEGRNAIKARRDALLKEWDAQEAACANPVLAEATARAEAAGEAEEAITALLLTTPPATLAGAVALLRYVESMKGVDYLAADCGDAGYGHDALVASLIETLAPMVAN